MGIHFRFRLAALGLAALLAACNGDGPATSAVRVAGDSLSDGGTFGFKFTIQESPTRIWVDHVAAAVGVAPLCPRYLATSAETVALNPAAAGCSSHGVADSRINVPDEIAGGDASPFSIVQQLKDLAQAGNYGPDELLLLDGGGNDIADLMRYWLVSAGDDGAAYRALLGELLTPDQVAAAVASGGLAQAGALYLDALAARFAEQIGEQALNRGARRVALLNMPAVTTTPYFRAMLALVAESSGAAAAAQVEAMAKAWVQAFNTRLAASFAGEHRVVIVDLTGMMQAWATSPGQPNRYGFTNTTDPACPSVGSDSLGLPTYLLRDCSAADLSASRPAGPDWWRGYLFADDFHGGPRANRLIGDLVAEALRWRGWL